MEPTEPTLFEMSDRQLLERIFIMLDAQQGTLDGLGQFVAGMNAFADSPMGRSLLPKEARKVMGV